MNGDIDANDTNLLVYYNFDDGDLDGTRDVIDGSVNNNNAQIIGDATYVLDGMVAPPTPTPAPTPEPVIITISTDSCAADEFMVGFEC